MTTLTRIALRDEVDATLEALIEKGHPYDAFASKPEEQQVRAALYDRWTMGVTRSLAMVRGQVGLTKENVEYIFNTNLGYGAMTRGLASQISTPVWTAFNNGRAASSALFTKQTGRDPMQKDMVGFGAIFGLTEDHALQAMLDQITIAAGGFWDQQLSDSIKAQLEAYFAGEMTREELVLKIEEMVNARLAIGGQSSLPSSYFDNLAVHQITRARNVGAYYRAKSLGAVHYRIMNPHDRRTCPICKPVTQGQLYTMSGAEAAISGILTARSTEDLKAASPWLKVGDDPANPVPPLHWAQCRCWMEFVFE